MGTTGPETDSNVCEEGEERRMRKGRCDLKKGKERRLREKGGDRETCTSKKIHLFGTEELDWR